MEARLLDEQDANIQNERREEATFKQQQIESIGEEAKTSSSSLKKEEEEGTTDSSYKKMPSWVSNFWWNTYCEDWPQYGRRNNKEAELRLPTLKIALQGNPQLLEGDRIPELTVREKFATINFVGSVFALTAQIAALMSLSRQFTNGVKYDDIKRIGQNNFDTVTKFLLYSPLVFALMIPFMYNTKRARDAFYVCLSKGYLLDFPESLKPSFFVSHFVSCIFVITVMLYFVFSILMFLWFQAEITIWIIFMNSVIFGLAMYWKDHFCLEGNLLSLSQFIEGVDDRDTVNGCIDDYTLLRAATVLRKLRPLRTRCSYKEYTSFAVFGKGKSKFQKSVARVSVFLAVGVFAAAMFGMFSFTANVEDQTKWKQQITPCAQVCFDHSDRDPNSCFNCMCDCATGFGAQFSQENCMSWFNVPGCSQAGACALNTNQTCGGKSF